jgi:hypothetical protein
MSAQDKDSLAAIVADFVFTSVRSGRPDELCSELRTCNKYCKIRFRSQLDVLCYQSNWFDLAFCVAAAVYGTNSNQYWLLL